MSFADGYLMDKSSLALKNPRVKVKSPTRPVYIRRMTMRLETGESEAVTPSERPTVEIAEMLSKKA